MIFLSNNLFASESIKLYVETSIYFVSNEGEKKIQDVAHMKKYLVVLMRTIHQQMNLEASGI